MYFYNNKDKVININDLQAEARDIYGIYDLNKSLIWMTEEFGELVQAIHKNKSKDDITGEFGDLIAWILCIANHLDISLNESVYDTFSKEINRQLTKYGKMKYCPHFNRIIEK